MKAYSLLPDRFEDKRHESFVKGLKAIGIEVKKMDPLKDVAGQGDLVLGWNAYGGTYQEMLRARDNGAQSLVFEEAYIRQIKGEQYFAIGLNGHNGSGTVLTGPADRWKSWEIEYQSKGYTPGGHILVCGQRGFGYNAMAMPSDWPDKILPQIREVTDRPVHFRAHPKRRAQNPSVKYDRTLNWEEPLADHLSGALACVVYTSNSATDALLRGIPAIYCGPNIVMQKTACHGVKAAFQSPTGLSLRDEAFIDLSWAQWSVAEIESGYAFDWILQQ
jgi:hypothetical protein